MKNYGYWLNNMSRKLTILLFLISFFYMTRGFSQSTIKIGSVSFKKNGELISSHLYNGKKVEFYYYIETDTVVVDEFHSWDNVYVMLNRSKTHLKDLNPEKADISTKDINREGAIRYLLDIPPRSGKQIITESWNAQTSYWKSLDWLYLTFTCESETQAKELLDKLKEAAD